MDDLNNGDWTEVNPQQVATAAPDLNSGDWHEITPTPLPYIRDEATRISQLATANDADVRAGGDIPYSWSGPIGGGKPAPAMPGQPVVPATPIDAVSQVTSTPPTLDHYTQASPTDLNSGAWQEVNNTSQPNDLNSGTWSEIHPSSVTPDDMIRSGLGAVAGAADVAIPFLGPVGFFAGMGAQAAGGLKGMGDIATWAAAKMYDNVTGQSNGKTFDQALAEAVDDINSFSKWTPSHVIEKLAGSEDYLTGSQGYQTVQKPIQYLGEKAAEGGSYVAEHTGSPALGALTSTALNFLPWIAGGKALESVRGKPTVVDPKDPNVIDAVANGMFGEIRKTLESIGNGETPISYNPDFKQVWETASSDPNANTAKLLDLVADHPNTDPTLRILAQQLRERSADLNLENTSVSVNPNLEPFGSHDSNIDHIYLRDNTDPRAVATFLHETTHALTASAIDMWNTIKDANKDPNTGNFIDPRWQGQTQSPRFLETQVDPTKITDQQKIIFEHIENLNNVFQEAKTRYFQTSGVDKSAFESGLVKYNNSNYMFKNLKEFAAEIMGGKPEVRETLSKLGELPDHLKVNASFEGRPIRGFWEAAKNYIRNLVVGGNSFYQKAFDHVTGVIQSMDTQTRTHNLSPGSFQEIAARKSEADYQSRVSKAVLQMSDRGNQFAMYRIANILRQAASPQEALFRIRSLQLTSPAWQKLINDHGFTLVKNAREIVNQFGTDTVFNKLSPKEKLLTQNSLSLEDYMKDHQQQIAADYVKAGLDPKNHAIGGILPILSKTDLIDEGTWMLPQTQIAALKSQGRSALTGDIAKFLIDKGREYQTLGAQLFSMASEHFRSYNELNNASKKSVMKAFIYFDGWQGSKQLKQLGLQWATEDMLKTRGMKPEEIQAYKDATEGQDFLWNLMNQALIKQGKDPLEQIPGYMPHFFDGAYRVLITRTSVDPVTKKPNTQVVRVRGFSTRMGANRLVKALNDGKFDGQDEAGNPQSFRPQIDTESGNPYRVILPEKPAEGISQSISDNVNSYKNMMKLDPSTMAAIEKMEQEAMRGTISHILERSNISGYRGDPMNEAAKDGGFETGLLSDLGLNPYNNKLLDTFNTYSRNVTEFYKNTLYMHEIGGPMFDHQPLDVAHKTYYGAMLDNTDKLKEFVEDTIRNFTGENLNPLTRIVDDEFIQPMLWLGLDPMLPQKFLQASRNILSLSKLRGNVGFYVGNFIQPAHMTWQLSWAKEMLKQDGKDVSNLSVAKAFIDAVNNRDSPEIQAFIQKARDRHVVDPRLEWELRHQPIGKLNALFHYATGGKLNPWIEQAAREFSMVVAHEFFKNVYPDDPEKIFGAAANSMEMVNVNYDKNSRPLMYQKFGMAGQAMSPFGVYRNAYIGNAWLMFRAVKSGKMSPSSFMPLLTMQMAYLATAGAAGVMLTDEWDTIAGMWNHFNPEAPVPESKQAFMRFQKAVGMGDWFTYGAVSTATKAIPGLSEGMYIGSSLNASGLDQTLDIALFPYWKAIANLVGLGTKEVGHLLMPETIQPPAASETYEAAKSLAPPQAQGLIERAYSPNLNVGTKGTELTGYVPRTDAGWHSVYVSGRPSVDEEKARMIQKYVDNEEEFRTKTVQALVNMAVDENEGIPAGLGPGERLSRAAANGVYPDEFAKMVVEEMVRRQTTAKYREGESGGDKALRMLRSRQTMEQ